MHVPDGWSLVSVRQGALGEFVATALLLVFILVLLERRSTNAPIGWGQMAFPGPRGDWWATTIAPTLGAIFGAYLFDFVLRPFMLKEAKPEVEAEKKPTPLPENVLA